MSVTLQVRVVRQERSKAFQVILANWWIIWVPKSKMGNPDSYRAGQRDVEIEIPEWLAQRIEDEYDWGTICERRVKVMS